jgi:hypothetical protein
MKSKRTFTALILGLGLASAFSMLIGQAAPSHPIVNPASNSHTAPPTTAISITYDEPMSATTITSHTFVVHAAQGGLVSGVYSLENEGKTIVLVPDAPFHPGELVHATATTATLSITGEHPITPTVWQFRTAVTGGSGYFAPHPTAPTFGAGERSYGITVGDVDGDGDLDAVVANWGTPQDVYLNDGLGHFTAHPISPTFGAGASYAVALGDLDSDGDLDVLVANGAAPQDVYLNNGLGCFAPHPISPTFGAGESTAIELGDVDGDGDLDAVVANWGTPQDVYLNDGTGGFARHPASSTFGAGQSFDVALGDLDDDGDLDAVVANYYNQAQAVYLNDGTGRFATHPISPTFGAGSSHDIALGDLDGDGDLDAVIANYYNNQAEDVYLNNGTGRFASHPISPTFGAGESSTVALGDLDGDGDLDAIVSNAEGQAEDVYLNDGTGCFAVHRTFGGGNSLGIVLGDVNDDGNLDALVANFATPQHTVWLNQDFVVYLPLVTRD